MSVQMGIDRDQPVDRRREQACEIRRRYRLAVMEAPILAHVRQIRRNEADARGAQAPFPPLPRTPAGGTSGSVGRACRQGRGRDRVGRLGSEGRFHRPEMSAFRAVQVLRQARRRSGLRAPRCREAERRGAQSFGLDPEHVRIGAGVVQRVVELARRFGVERAKGLPRSHGLTEPDMQLYPGGLGLRRTGKLREPGNPAVVDRADATRSRGQQRMLQWERQVGLSCRPGHRKSSGILPRPGRRPPCGRPERRLRHVTPPRPAPAEPQRASRRGSFRSSGAPGTPWRTASTSCASSAGPIPRPTGSLPSESTIVV